MCGIGQKTVAGSCEGWKGGVETTEREASCLVASNGDRIIVGEGNEKGRQTGREREGIVEIYIN